MENRITDGRSQRPGAALAAAVAIVAITAAWWALALWPVGAVEPEWLARTRSACFGSARGGLPDAGGWILLIGEPVGMAVVLFALWGDSLRANLAWIWSRRLWRASAISVVAVAAGFFTILGFRVAKAQAADPTEFSLAPGGFQKVDRSAPPVAFVDQNGKRVSLADNRSSPLLLTFAYGHCTTVCPAIVSQLRIARKQAQSTGVRIAIVTLDPWRDTPERLPTLASHWGLAGGDIVLSGSVPEVEMTLDALAIGRKRNETTGDVDHGTTVMLVDRKGKVRWRVDGGTVDFARLIEKESGD